MAYFSESILDETEIKQLRHEDQQECENCGYWFDAESDTCPNCNFPASCYA